jgi:hypothetical protein
VTLAELARRVVSLVETVRDDNLDSLCEACGAAEMLVGALEARIRRLVEQQDREPCRAPERRVC